MTLRISVLQLFENFSSQQMINELGKSVKQDDNYTKRTGNT